MPRQRRDLDLPRQKDKVFKQLKTEPSGILRERLQAVSLGLKGELSLGEIAQAAGRSRATIQTWFDLYRMGGIEGLKPSKNSRGPSSRLHEEARKELKKKLAKGSFHRAADARDWLKRRFGIEASTSRVAFWMGKCGARLKAVRPRHPKSCERARLEFRNQMARKAFQDRKRPLKEWLEGTAPVDLKERPPANLGCRRSALRAPAVLAQGLGDARSAGSQKQSLSL